MTIALGPTPTARRLTRAVRAVVAAPGWWRWPCVVLVVVVGAATVPIVGDVGPTPTSHTGAFASMALLDLAAGLGLLLAGGAAWFHQPRFAVGALAISAGLAWLAVDWVAWADGPAGVRSLALLVTPFMLPVLVHLAMVFPAGRVTSRPARILVAGTYVAAATVSSLWALFRDPFRERHCWNGCPTNEFGVWPDPDLSATVTGSWRWFSIVAALAVVTGCGARLLRATPTARRAMLPVLAPVAAVLLALAAHAIALLVDPAEATRKAHFVALFGARAAALVLLAGGLIVTTGRGLLRRRDVARLAAHLAVAPAPGALRAALAATLGDPSVEVGYRIPGQERLVDSSGRPLDPPASRDQVVTPIVRNGTPVADVIHDAALGASHHLERDVGAATRLAIDNERLLAQAMLQLRELRESQRRIVNRSDLVRRRLEQNLHDGAQQRLLALAYALQLGLADARTHGDVAAATAFESAIPEATRALTELRDLAHGIFPAILAEAGLRPALNSFADVAPVRVDIGNAPAGRLASEVESAVYVAITDTVDLLGRRGRGPVALSWSFASRPAHAVLRVTIDTEAEVQPGELTAAADRIAAVGGDLVVDGPSVVVEVPCEL